MFKTIVSAATFQDTLDSVGVLVDECKTRPNEESLSTRAVDSVNVGMVDLMPDVAAFKSYEAHGGVIGVNLSRLEEVARMAGAGGLIHLTFNGETRKLNIHINELSYTLALIGPDSIRQEPDIPDLNLAANIVLEGTHLDCGIKAADMVSNHIRLRADGVEKASHIEAEGDTDDVNLSLPSADFTSIEAGAAGSLFSLDCLEDMNKAIPTDAEVTAELGGEFPVKLYYQIAKGMGTTTYMLTPRIQSN